MADIVAGKPKSVAQMMARKEDQLKRLKKKGWKPPTKKRGRK